MGLLLLKLRAVRLESRTESRLDFKLVYILGKTVQEMVLDIYLREIAGKSGDAVLMFLMLFFKSIGIFS